MNRNATTVVFVKIPRPGFVKTRIAAEAGPQRALEIYNELLRRTAYTVADIPHHIAFAGGVDPGPLSGIFTGAKSFFQQEGNTLGVRLKNAFTHLYQQGYTHICAIGSDCPVLQPATIQASLDALDDTHDLAVGPAEDGGYYLISCKINAVTIFNVTGWGTPSLFEKTIQYAEKKRFAYTVLDTKYDIDTLHDYLRWQKESATCNEGPPRYTV